MAALGRVGPMPESGPKVHVRGATLRQRAIQIGNQLIPKLVTPRCGTTSKIPRADRWELFPKFRSVAAKKHPPFGRSVMLNSGNTSESAETLVTMHSPQARIRPDRQLCRNVRCCSGPVDDQDQGEWRGTAFALYTLSPRPEIAMSDSATGEDLTSTSAASRQT